jgi:hypothetical protein
MRWELSVCCELGSNTNMSDESQDTAAQEANVRSLVAAAHEYITAGDGRKAVDAFNEAGEAALNLLVTQIESADEQPGELSDDDRAAWRLAADASTEYQHANNALGDWYREGARRRALERYTALDF